MKKWLLFLFSIGSFTFLHAAPRNPYPTTPSDVWQNDLDLNDAINKGLSGLPTAYFSLNCSSVPCLNVSGYIPNSEIDPSSITKLGNGNIAFQGRTTNTFQPSFLAYNSTIDSNVTGDNTNVTVPFDTKQYDQASNFASNTFTAPVTGHYLLSTGVTIRDTTTGNKCELKIVTTAKTFVQEYWPASNIAIAFTVLASMSASDTALVTLNCSGGSKVVDILGSNGTTTGAGEPTFFSGTLVN